MEQVDTFLCSEEQRISDLFYDADLAEAVIASSERPELEEVMQRNRTVTARLSWHPRGFDPQLRKWLHRIRVPTLLVWGADDRLVPLAYGEAWARAIPGARLVTLDRCGHLPPLEQPERFAAIALGFLDA